MPDDAKQPGGTAIDETLPAEQGSVDTSTPKLTSTDARRGKFGRAPADTLAPTDATLHPTQDVSSMANGATLPATSSTHAEDLPVLPTVQRSHYTIHGELARGGMGRILWARDRRHRRPVALKELLSTNPSAVARFQREALITARLQHPAIVPLYEAGTWEDGEPFYAMKKVDGRALDDVIAKAKTLSERLALLPNVLAVADALAYAHSQRVIHRDLKPANVLVGAFGETVVIDWGLAKDLAADNSAEAAAAEGTLRAHGSPAPSADLSTLSVAPSELPDPLSPSDDRLTVAGVAMGTPAYMPPEQARGEPVDERADVYSLGALLYHVLAGRIAYADAKSVKEVLTRLAAGPPAPLRELAPGAPAELLTIVDTAMARDPADRYPTAAELSQDLRRFETGQLVGAHTYTMAALVRRWMRRHRALVTVGAAAIVVVLVSAGWFLTRERRLRGEAEAAERIAVAARHEADAERSRAERSLAHGLAEQGRAELLAQRPAHAAAYLSASYQTLPSDPVVRSMLADAMRSVDALQFKLEGHTDLVRTASFSPDGTRIVSASADGTARIWDTGTGRAISTLNGHSGWVRSASFSPDGTRIVTASADGTARIWDVATGRTIVSLGGHDDNLQYWASFSPDGTRIFTASADGTARIWDAATGGLHRALDGHTGLVSSASFSPDGTRIVTASDDATARVWNADTGRALAVLGGHSGRLSSAAFSPDGSRVVTSSEDRTAMIWSALSGRAIARLEGHTDWVLSARFTPDGARIATTSYDHTVRIWDSATGRALQTLAGHSGGVRSASFSPDGARMVTASEDRTARIWDTRTGRHIATLDGHTHHVWSASFDGSGQRIVTASWDKTLRVWGAPVDRELSMFDPNTRTVAVAFVPDGARLVTRHDQTAQIWDAVTGRQISTLAGNAAEMRSASFSADGTRLVTSDDADQVARLWDVVSGRLIGTLEGHTDEVRWAAFTPDRARIVTASADRTARIWDTASGRLIVTLEGHTDQVLWASFSPDGARVVTASDDQTVRIWDAASGSASTTLAGHMAGVTSASFSPDGARVLTTSADNSARVWDVATGRTTTTLEGHQDKVWSASFSPDGARVVTASDDQTVRIWDSATGRMIGILDGRLGPARFALFSADGARILTNPGGERARIWDCHLEGRGPDEIARIVAQKVPWEVVGGQLVPRPSEKGGL